MVRKVPAHHRASYQTPDRHFEEPQESSLGPISHSTPNSVPGYLCQQRMPLPSLTSTRVLTTELAPAAKMEQAWLSLSFSTLENMPGA